MALQILRSTPSFTVTLRGYDKDEVDDYIESLRDQQGDETEALEAADRTIRALELEVRSQAERVAKLEACVRGESPRTISAFGERLTMILEEAESTATQTVTTAQQEADATREEAALAADRITRYAAYQASEAESRAAAVTRDAEEGARQVEENARRKATEILDEAEHQVELRIADINRWVGRVRAQIEAEQAQAAEEFATIRAHREAELRDVAARRDGLLASLTAVCESVAETVTTHRAAGYPTVADLSRRAPRSTDGPQPFDQATIEGGENDNQTGEPDSDADLELSIPEFIAGSSGDVIAEAASPAEADEVETNLPVTAEVPVSDR